jgi:hypothetical protein
VTDHIFGHENLNKALSVVNAESVSDKIRNDEGATAPSFDRGLCTGHFLDFVEQMLIDKRSFFD